MVALRGPVGRLGVAARLRHEVVATGSGLHGFLDDHRHFWDPGIFCEYRHERWTNKKTPVRCPIAEGKTGRLCLPGNQISPLASSLLQQFGIVKRRFAIDMGFVLVKDFVLLAIQ